tara:strand:- start:54 stop:485 length:432 start_codon:yes stop_codon:yes gene_type:complete
MSKQTYIMKSGNKYKIGKSEDTSSRLKALQTGNPDIKIILCCEESKVSEKALHNMFSHKRGDGEWFSLTASDIKICKNLMGDRVKQQKVQHNFYLSAELSKKLKAASYWLDKTQADIVSSAISKHLDQLEGAILEMNREIKDE